MCMFLELLHSLHHILIDKIDIVFSVYYVIKEFGTRIYKIKYPIIYSLE